MKTQYDNWDCEGSHRKVNRLRRRVGWLVLLVVVAAGVAVVGRVMNIW